MHLRAKAIASASAIEQLSLGDASAEVSVKCATHVGLSLIGQSGPVAPGLFRLRLGGDPTLLDFGSPGAPPEVSVDPDPDWSDDPDEP